MKVKDCQINNQYTAFSGNKSVSEVIDKIRNNRFAIITENKKPIGILTTDDIVTRVLVAKKDPKTTRLKDIMSSPVATTSLDEDLKKVSSMMIKKNFLSLPVIDKKGDLVGVVTVYDILSKLREKK